MAKGLFQFQAVDFYFNTLLILPRVEKDLKYNFNSLKGKEAWWKNMTILPYFQIFSRLWELSKRDKLWFGKSLQDAYCPLRFWAAPFAITLDLHLNMSNSKKYLGVVFTKNKIENQRNVLMYASYNHERRCVLKPWLRRTF